MRKPLPSALLFAMCVTSQVSFGATVGTGQEIGVATYRALLIGVQDYTDKDVPGLRAPVADVKAIATVLSDQYGFTDVRVLATPADTTRLAIINALDRLSADAKPDDAVLLYFAGHGLFVGDPDPRRAGQGQGYWIPSDGTRASRGTWISNADVLDTIRLMPARHVLVVSDACFAGSLLNVRDLTPERIPADVDAARRLASKPSRWVIASAGQDEPAFDIYKDGLSVFAYMFRKVLVESGRHYLDPESFFSDLRDGVMDLSRQTPVEGAMVAGGHEGGAFVMVNRKATEEAEPTRPTAEVPKANESVPPSKATAVPSGDFLARNHLRVFVTLGGDLLMIPPPGLLAGMGEVGVEVFPSREWSFLVQGRIGLPAAELGYWQDLFGPSLGGQGEFRWHRLLGGRIWLGVGGGYTAYNVTWEPDPSDSNVYSYFSDEDVGGPRMSAGYVFDPHRETTWTIVVFTQGAIGSNPLAIGAQAGVVFQ